jgi:hypothetical protein
LNEKDNGSGGFFELGHLFSGHQIEAESSFEISGTTDTDENIKFSFCLKDIPLQE